MTESQSYAAEFWVIVFLTLGLPILGWVIGSIWNLGVLAWARLHGREW